MLLLPPKLVGSETEKKASVIDVARSFGVLDFEGGLRKPNAWHPIGATEASNLYQQNSALFAAIDIITQEFATLTPVVTDLETGEISEDHPVLRLLKAPNAYETEDFLLGALARTFLISGNGYLTAQGNVTRPPLSIFVELPADIDIDISSKDRYPTVYRLTSSVMGGSINYVRHATSLILPPMEAELFGMFRFWARANRAADLPDLEIYHTRSFNPSPSHKNSLGFSKMSSVFYEIQQLIEGNIHNWSLLKRGTRPTGALSEKDNASFTQTQKDQFSAQINNLYTGSENTGRPIYIPRGLEFSEFSTSNRDMDFVALKQAASDAIYNVYRVPLALMTASAMTLSNFKEAKLFLYDNAVIPLANLLFGELTRFLMPRFGEDPFKFSITFNPDKIPALEPRRIDRIERLSKIGIFTTNELRAQIGEEPLEGGDSVLLPSNLLPLLNTIGATPPMPPPDPTTPGAPPDDATPDDESQAARDPIETFVETAKTLIDAGGIRLYSDEEIKIISKYLQHKGS